MDPLYQRQSYSFDLPDELIAQQPMEGRDQSRLLMADRNRVLGHHHFADLAELLPQETLLVLNDSKVIASRLFGRTEHGGRIELFLLEPLDAPFVWQCLAKPLRKTKVGTRIYFAGGCYAEVLDRPPSVPDEVPTITVRLETGGEPVDSWLQQTGIVPLPPYIERRSPTAFHQSPDRTAYQTVYAQHAGSAAAPTAGLHFTPELFDRLCARGVECCYTTLHVGSGTFLPVKADDIRNHKMHSERYTVPSATVTALIEAVEQCRPIVAVGTTSLRSLEAFARLTQSNPDSMRAHADRQLRTDIFIYPQSRAACYQPSFAAGMVTNFHQPESSLLMFVAALMGLSHIKSVYQEAINQRYRFFSYGDACMLWFAP